MKPRHVSFRLTPSASALVAAVLAATSTSHGAIFTWDGGHATSNSWGSADNWNPNTTPTFNNLADIQFTAPTTRPNIFIGGNRTVRSLTFGAGVNAAMQVNFQDFAAGSSRNLTLEADIGNASINITSGATGAITMGNAGGGGAFGNLILADNLDIVHNGSGILLLNRPVQGAFDITKTGTGTLQLSAFNTFTGALKINEGTVLVSAQTATGDDLDTVSSINLGGGTLAVRPGFANKTYDTAPVIVSAASTLTYENTAAFTYTLQFTGSSSFTLDGNLTVKNISTDTTLVSALNIARSMTGTGDMIVETFNNINSSAANFSLGRVLLSGNNSGWSGDLVVAKGTASLSGDAVNAAGTGNIVIGTTADTFGAGLTFFPTGTAGTTVSYNNDITVRSGGFRSIKGSGTDHNIVLGGDIALEGDLNLDPTLAVAGRHITLDGEISGVGGLNITRSGGSSDSFALMTGTNTYTGDTTVTAGKLVVAGSIGNSPVTVSGAGTVLATDAAASFGSTLAIQNGAILAPGDAGTAGTATVTGSTTFNNGSIFSWDINSTGANYDKLLTAGLVDGDAAGGSVFRIVVSDATFTDAFWNTTRTWTDIFTTDGTTTISGWADILTSVSVVNSGFAPIAPTNGSFSASGNTLTWTAVPEPTSALAGLLLATGLLRRRRLPYQQSLRKLNA